MNILIIGRHQSIIDAAHAELAEPGLCVLGATSPAEVEDALAHTDVQHVFMGPGLPLDTRLDIVRSVFDASDSTCVHMKDFSRGPEGALDFVRGILHGLTAEYHH